jgi:hypothetical protein
MLVEEFEKPNKSPRSETCFYPTPTFVGDGLHLGRKQKSAE